jgi:TonB family protein
MNAVRERARNFLAYGFGISIAVHLIVLPFVHAPATATEEEHVPRTVRIDHIPTPPPTPPPTPTPKPTVPPTPPPREHPPTPAPHAQQLRIRPPQITAHAGGQAEHPNTHATGDPNAMPQLGTPGPATGEKPATPAPAATPAVTPKPTPTPLSCARPAVPATTVRALEPDTPTLAQQQGISGVVQVVVSLDAQSRVVGTRIQSSPSVVLNQAALAAARGSQFRTEVKNCEPVAADYIFSVDFTAQ